MCINNHNNHNNHNRTEFRLILISHCVATCAVLIPFCIFSDSMMHTPSVCTKIVYSGVYILLFSLRGEQNNLKQEQKCTYIPLPQRWNVSCLAINDE